MITQFIDTYFGVFNILSIKVITPHVICKLCRSPKFGLLFRIISYTWHNLQRFPQHVDLPELDRCWNQGISMRHNMTLQWRQNGRDGVSNHQAHDCLLNPFFRRRSKKTSKLCVIGLCAGNSPVTRKIFQFDDIIIINSAINFTTHVALSSLCERNGNYRLVGARV